MSQRMLTIPNNIAWPGLMLYAVTVSVAWAALPTCALRGDDAWKLANESLPENSLADREVRGKLRLTGPAARGLRLDWRVVIERRVLQRGSIASKHTCRQADRDYRLCSARHQWPQA